MAQAAPDGSTFVRPDGRARDQLRPVVIEPNPLIHPEGSALISLGNTRVMVTASLEDKVPPFLKGHGQGWITAEYGMLPRATADRTPREVSRGRVAGRTSEIQRLIGRSLRAAFDLTRIGERTIWVDCDVLQADGGTRTASITGAFVAVALALHRVMGQGGPADLAARGQLVAISAGVVDGVPLLDLAYAEDSRASLDMNVVMLADGRLVELQAGGEGGPFAESVMGELLTMARAGVAQLAEAQRRALGPEVAALLAGGSA